MKRRTVACVECGEPIIVPAHMEPYRQQCCNACCVRNSGQTERSFRAFSVRFARFEIRAALAAKGQDR